VRCEPLDPAARLRLESGVDEANVPVDRVGAMHAHLRVGEIDRQVVRELGLIEDVTLDDVTLISQSDDEIFEIVGRVVAHDVPQDRDPADLDHRLWSRFGFLRQARTESAGEDRNLDIFFGRVVKDTRPTNQWTILARSDMSVTKFFIENLGQRRSFGLFGAGYMPTIKIPSRLMERLPVLR
jgi:hypothetical protein